MTENQTAPSAAAGNGAQAQLPVPQGNALRLHSQGPPEEPHRQIEPRIARMEAEMDAARSRGVLGPDAPALRGLAGGAR